MEDGQDPSVDNSGLYKEFGRETDIGKMLFGMYAAREKPKVFYPPVKTKKRGEEIKERKPCPQKTVIEYPEMEPKSKYNFAPIDFVPKRKAAKVII